MSKIQYNSEYVDIEARNAFPVNKIIVSIIKYMLHGLLKIKFSQSKEKVTLSLVAYFALLVFMHHRNPLPI